MDQTIKSAFCFLLLLFIISQFSLTELSAQNLRKIETGTGTNFKSLTFTASSKGIAVGELGKVHNLAIDSNNARLLTEITPPININAIAVKDNYASADSDCVIAGDGGNIFYSRNLGNTWQKGNTPVSTNLNDIVMVKDPVHGAVTCYAVGDNSTVLVSADSGSTWTPQTTPYHNEHFNSISFINKNEGWIAGTAGIIYRTTNGGSAWNYIAGPHSNPNFKSVRFINSTTGWLCGAGGKIFKTTNSGGTWVEQTSSITTDLNSIDMCGPDSGFAVGNNGVILQTTNGGTNWQNVPSSTVSDLHKVKYNSNSKVVIVGGNGSIFTNIPLIPVGIEKNNRIPASSFLFPAYPNPFNPSTKLIYSISKAGPVSLIVYDCIGRKAAVLVDSESTHPGIHNAVWNASGFPSGIYIISLYAEGKIQSQKLLLLK